MVSGIPSAFPTRSLYRRCRVVQAVPKPLDLAASRELQPAGRTEPHPPCTPPPQAPAIAAGVPKEQGIARTGTFSSISAK